MKPFVYITACWGTVLLGAWIYTSSEIPRPPGILAPDDPRQVDIMGRSWDRGDIHFEALAQFDMRGRVLSSSHYSFDAESIVAPVDLALGWGRMSDTAVLEQMSLGQGTRCYYWRPRHGHPLPLPMDEIIAHSSNMHMIPATDAIKKTLRDVRAGEVVELKGYLVEVTRPHGWRWRSSLTRTDTGMGACELVWVDELSRSAATQVRAGR
jgi:hypothetical protein